MNNVTNKIKKTSLIRWNAIVPFIFVLLLAYLYFVTLFDFHVKKSIEWVGYKALGSELNIESFNTSFIKGRIEIKKIEITSKENPNYNSIEIGNVKFDLNWDALLRAKIVIEEIAVENLQFMSKRTRIGRIAPPEPPTNDPSFAQQIQDKALNKLNQENQNNILGDTAQFLKTGQFDSQIKNMEGQLTSKKLIEDLQIKWSEKKKNWDIRFKTLPSTSEINALTNKFNSINLSNITTLEELQTSTQQVEALLKEIDARNADVQAIKTDFENDLKSLDQDYKLIDKQIKSDIENLKSHFKIPKIDAASFAKAMFMDYLTPHLKTLASYKLLAQKYLPPKYAKKLDGKSSEPVIDDSIQPHPRTSGIVYEFPIKNGYPLFWIQKINLSSKSNQQADYGDFSGQITNITSNQRQIGKPTVAKIDGAFRKAEISGIKLNLLFDNMPSESVVKFDFGIDSYPIEKMQLISSNEGNIELPKTLAKLSTYGEVIGFKKYNLGLTNTFNDVLFKIDSNNDTIKEILNKTLATIHTFNLQASIKGEISDLNVDIRSSLGGDLEKAFQQLLQNKIKEANEQLQKAINLEIDKIRGQFYSQIESLKSQATREVKNVESQIDQQKKDVESKVTQAKKEYEDKVNKAKKEAEENAKKLLQKEGQKQLDDLKKKLGL